MFHALEGFRAMLPELLEDEAGWQSLYVDYEKPHVERLWRDMGDFRLFLHRIHPCTRAEALYHPHPWPSAMLIMNGEYEMGVGYGAGDKKPPIAATLFLAAGSRYEMVDPDGWHYVRPLGRPSLSFMVTDTPWNRWSPKSGRLLRGLTENERARLFADFRALLNR